MKPSTLLKHIFAFFLILFFGLLSTGIFFDEKQSIENRMLLSWNKLELGSRSPGDIFRLLTRVFEDNFVFRTELIKTSNFFDLNIFKSNPVGGFVIGENGWEFYAGDENLLDQAGLRTLSGAQLYEVTNNIENSIKELLQQGVKPSILVVPNKATIYREYLPKNFKRINAKTRADQIMKFSGENQLLERLVFNKEFYLAQKVNHESEIYEKKGSHWNDLGAFFGYLNLMQNIGLEPLSLSQYDIKDQFDYTAMSSTYMPTFNNFKSLKSPVLTLNSRPNLKTVMKVGTPSDFNFEISGVKPDQPHSIKVLENLENKKPSLLIFGDSFSDKLLPFLAPHFSVITFVGSRFIDHNFVREQSPDFVVHEISERFFSGVYLKPNPTLVVESQTDLSLEKSKKFKNYFTLNYQDGKFYSNLEETLLIQSINQKNLDFQGKISGDSLITSSYLLKGQIVLDFARVVPEKIKVSIHGKFENVSDLKLVSRGSDDAILSIVVNGQEAKVSFNENGIFVGSAIANIPAGSFNIKNISLIELLVVDNDASLYLNGNEYINWKIEPSNAPNRLLFGDFSQKSSRKFSFNFQKLEIITE